MISGYTLLEHQPIESQKGIQASSRKHLRRDEISYVTFLLILLSIIKTLPKSRTRVIAKGCELRWTATNWTGQDSENRRKKGVKNNRE